MLQGRISMPGVNRQYEYPRRQQRSIVQYLVLSDSIKQRFRSLDEERKAAKKKVKRRDAKTSEENAEVKEAYDNQSRTHWHDHIALRINDSKEVQFGEVNNAKLQQELHKIATDVHALEGKVTAHLKTATQWIKASVEPGAADLESDFGLQSDYSEPILVAKSPPAGLANDAAETRHLMPNIHSDDTPSGLPSQTDSSGNINLLAIPTAAPPIAQVMETRDIDHVGPLLQVTYTSVPAQETETRNPNATNHLASLDAGLSSLQLRVASLDSRMSGLESSLAATASNTDSRLSRVESQLSELLSLLGQLAAR
ncbi:hypothetical protein D9619_009986 [Psilocybe cf. subviscida]|uniref:Uncharacterized protein n=1 Tax=Psilocybe cf. subviscida TaxID=2480587 RepID=A0A8H5F6G3_9AGAR|nr:hypothetical protein D9619_009986 [Psilocybe cf. subviscida]